MESVEWEEEEGKHEKRERENRSEHERRIVETRDGVDYVFVFANALEWGHGRRKMVEIGRGRNGREDIEGRRWCILKI